MHPDKSDINKSDISDQMKSFYKKQRLRIITLAYWFLLVYILSGFVWWFISLENQNNQTFAYKVEELKKDDPKFPQRLSELEDARKRKHYGYIGEGITFLLVTLVGAVFVYRATKRQLNLNHQQQNFMMAVTHELKTPIAITRLNLETLQKRKLEEAQQQKLISNTLNEVNRLNVLCNNILVASQLDAGSYSINKQDIDLSKLVDECITDYRQRYPQRAITGNVQENLYFEGEPLLLQMLASNLVDNALKYSPKTSEIAVTLRTDNNSILFSVADEGEGIPDTEKKMIFEKFYRVGDEATRKAKGTGLGLYLCKRIVKDHGGHIAVTDNHPKGSVFTVRF
ncbi:HAMP domain-containing sensor histidine kinase [Danxiaibacter flavus]|uniref:histidine kinase n=1 Tax=Danxiaibacter flavus TaxID=3049108 RepID=A0ABV3ZES8_9BACT|nr:HAMP domain-containing sensor histidine kinase [Chitinophagaceae bacterium DXS]